MFGRIGSAAIALGLIVGCPAVLSQERIEPALESQPVPDPRQHEGSEQSQTSASQQEAAAADVVPALKAIEGAIRDLIAEEDATQRKRQEQRQIADLHAQQDMAFWAKAMFWATFSTVIVTLIGIFLIWRTLIHTRKAAAAAEAAVDEARKGTAAATRGTDAAIEANKIHVGSLTLQNRAWLKIMQVEITSSLCWVKKENQIGEITFAAVAKNVGVTPAVEVFFRAGLRQPRYYIDQTGITQSNSLEILRDELAFVQRMRSIHGSASNISLFRGDIVPQQWICSIPDSDIIIDPHTGQPRDTSNDVWYQNIIMIPLLIVYVDYRLVFAKEYHQTVEIYRLRRTTPGMWMTPAEGDIPAEELAIERLGFGGTYTN